MVELSVVVGSFAVFIDVQAFFFDAAADSYALDFMHCEHNDPTQAECPDADAQNAKCLNSKQMCSASVEQSILGGEQTHAHSPYDSADSVNRNRSHRVVNPQLMLEELDRSGHSRAANGTDNCRSRHRHKVAACSNPHKSRKNTVANQ